MIGLNPGREAGCGTLNSLLAKIEEHIPVQRKTNFRKHCETNSIYLLSNGGKVPKMRLQRTPSLKSARRRKDTREPAAAHLLGTAKRFCGDTEKVKDMTLSGESPGTWTLVTGLRQL